ncbi:MAG: DUF6430 domain-containing protein [Chitinispirillia bacterium]|nr:DUF6430 domain-containing protein [Chitinispirillia bacterium]
MFNLIIFQLRHCFKVKIIIKNLAPVFLSVLGSFWLIIEFSAFMFGEATPFILFTQEHWFLLLIIGLLIAIIYKWPKLTFECKLDNRDTSIEIVIGDLFKQNGSLIIGTNTTFDTHLSQNLISEKSIQGQFTKKFYYGNEIQLDKEIYLGLQGIQFETLHGDRIGKNKKYPIGTIVKLNPANRTVYIVAIANINEHGVAKGTYDDLKKTLAEIWFFISKKGLKENLLIPVLGTGFARLPQTREEIIREIVKSFIAACSESTFSDKLTIVLSPNDVEKHNIDMEELKKSIEYLCKYTSFSNSNEKIGYEV